MQVSRWRWSKRIALLAMVLGALAFGSIPFVFPAVAAYACPGCYGLERVAKNLSVEPAMPAEDRARLQKTIALAEAKVAAFYGSFERRPALLACVSQECDRKLGGRGARATTYTIPNRSVVRLGPNGLNETIAAHEFSHVELHRRIGFRKLALGAVPAWFDEGLAVIVSGDHRYLKPGATSAERCMTEQADELPTSPFKWAPMSGKTPGLYAEAACRVLQWMDANGGKAGLLTAIAQVTKGERRLP